MDTIEMSVIDRQEQNWCFLIKQIFATLLISMPSLGVYYFLLMTLSV